MNPALIRKDLPRLEAALAAREARSTFIKFHLDTKLRHLQLESESGSPTEPTLRHIDFLTKELLHSQEQAATIRRIIYHACEHLRLAIASAGPAPSTSNPGAPPPRPASAPASPSLSQPSPGPAPASSPLDLSTGHRCPRVRTRTIWVPGCGATT